MVAEGEVGQKIVEEGVKSGSKNLTKNVNMLKILKIISIFYSQNS